MKLSPLLIALCIGNLALSQVPDNIYAEGEVLPGNNITDVSKLKAGLSLPLIKNENNSLSIGGDYQYTQYDYIDKDIPYETSEIERFYMVSASLKYAHTLGNQWSFTALVEGQLSPSYSNITRKENYFVNGTLLLRKIDTIKNSIWSFGVIYDHQYGFNTPIPAISYYKEASEKWSYKIGVPEMETHYKAGKSHDFSAFAKLDGFMGAFNEDLEISRANFDGTGILRQTTVIGGLGYSLKLWGNSSLDLKGGYTLYNNLSVTDYDYHDIYNFDIKNYFYFHAGIKVLIPNKLLD